MKKASMAAERLRQKRKRIDTWTTREKLLLANAVKIGQGVDQNWRSVSRGVKSNMEKFNSFLGLPERPAGWFSGKNCCLQYEVLLEWAWANKDKNRGERGEKADKCETPGQIIVNHLTELHKVELDKECDKLEEEYLKEKRAYDYILTYNKNNG